MNEIDAVHTKSIAQKAVLLDQENVQLKAKIAELERENRTLVRDCAIAVEDGYNKRDQIAHIESDLQAARTAAELAATHHEASDILIREFQAYMRSQGLCEGKNGEPVAELAPNWIERENALHKRADELLGEVTLTPSKAEEARDMLIEQYNRVLGEVNHA